MSMTGELSNDPVAKAYAQWARFAPIYDLVFGPALSQGRKDSIAHFPRADRSGTGRDVSRPVARPKHGVNRPVDRVAFIGQLQSVSEQHRR